LLEKSGFAGTWARDVAGEHRIGTGRKLAIIILEFFDRTRVTIRRGDLRKVQRDRLRTFAAPAREPI